jgi:hypothetical protein
MTHDQRSVHAVCALDIAAWGTDPGTVAPCLSASLPSRGMTRRCLVRWATAGMATGGVLACRSGPGQLTPRVQYILDQPPP